MGIEELKIVMETFQQMGETGKDAFIWYMIFKYAMMYLMWLILLPATLFAVYKVILKCSGSDNREMALRRMRDDLNVGSSGHLTDAELSTLLVKFVILLSQTESSK